MKFFPALLIGVKLNWCLGRLNRIERRPARQIQEYVADSSAADEVADGYRSANVNVGILSEKEGRRLQASTSCAPEDIVDCVEGLSTYVNSTGDNVTISCEAACEGNCCDGTDACLNFTGNVCKDMTSCFGTYACKNANIAYVFNSCNGRSACEETGNDGGYVGNVTNSCNGEYACKYAASSEGNISSITNSCNDGSFACRRAACEGGTIGSITNSCNGDVPYSYSCQNAARAADGYIGFITNSCNDGKSACTNAAFGGYIGFIKDSCNATRACENLAAELPERRKLQEEIPFKVARASWKVAKDACQQDPEAQLNACWKDWCKENDSLLCGIWCASPKKAETKRCSDGFLEDTWASVKDDCPEGPRLPCWEQWCTDNPFKCNEWCLKDSNVSKNRCTNRITGPGPMSSPPSRSPTSAPTSAPTPSLSCVNECCNAVSICDNIPLAEIASQDVTCQPCEGVESGGSEIFV